MRRKIKIPSYPKINLALDILGKDPSGYHRIQTVFHELSEPFDELIFEESDKIEVECDNPRVPSDETNTVLKAALLLKESTRLRRVGAKIFIKKKTPLMSGLGGGASNAAAALKGLAKLWNISCCHDERAKRPMSLRAKRSNLADPSPLARDGALAPDCFGGQRPPRNDKHTPQCLLLRLANQIGMDCAFFFHGGTALGEHFGEKITPLPSLPPEIKFEIIETGVEISSHWAYSQINLKRCGKNLVKTEKLIRAIREKNTAGILENLHNDFEPVIFKKFPPLSTTISHYPLLSSTLLCGSGGALVRCYSSSGLPSL